MGGTIPSSGIFYAACLMQPQFNKKEKSGTQFLAEALPLVQAPAHKAARAMTISINIILLTVVILQLEQ